MEGYEIMISNRKVKFSHQVSVSLLLSVIIFFVFMAGIVLLWHNYTI